MTDSTEMTRIPGETDTAKTTDLDATRQCSDGDDIFLPGASQGMLQSTAIKQSPAVCTAAAKWKSQLASAGASGPPLQSSSVGDEEDGALDRLSLPPGTPEITAEGAPLVEPASPSHHLNGSAHTMVRPSISITEAPQVGRPPSQVLGSERASASSMSMLAESGKLLQAVPLPTGSHSGQHQEIELVTLRNNNHSLLSAIPYMPVGLAYVCLILNIAVPGSGTFMAGFSLFCCKAQPQANRKKDDIINSFCTNSCVAVSQLFTIPFLFVGWIWSVTWGVFMVIFAIEYRNYKKNEKKISTAKAVTKAFMGR